MSDTISTFARRIDNMEDPKETMLALYDEALRVASLMRGTARLLGFLSTNDWPESPRQRSEIAEALTVLADQATEACADLAEGIDIARA